MTLSFIDLIIVSLLVCLSLQGLLWLIHLRHSNAGYVDLGWTAGIGLSAAIVLFFADGDFAKRLLLCFFPLLWSVRLSLHIAQRLSPGMSEDRRYAKLRGHFGSYFWLFMLPFFLLQGVLSVLLTLPVLHAASSAHSELKLWEVIGVALMVVALLLESVADMQLTAFKANKSNHDAVCRAGLWRYSRHPNYFFEWVFWVGLGLSCVTLSWGVLFSILSPLIMFVLLTRVTGIPPTEAVALEKRPESYARYQAEVSAFFPWFPRGGA